MAEPGSSPSSPARPTAQVVEGTVIKLDLPVLLPDVGETRDACVGRLIRLLEEQPGVIGVHIIPGDQRTGQDVVGLGDAAPAVPVSEAQLCLHYDPEVLTLAQITAVAQSAGATVSDRFAHAVLPFREVGAEDEGARIEAELRDIRGVTAASVNFAGQVARVEYDRTITNVAAIERHLEKSTAGPGWYERNRELAWSLIAGALLGAGWLAARAAQPGSWLPIAVYAAAYFFGARDNVSHFIRDLRRRRFRFNIDLLMVVAAVGAAALGAWFEGALLLFLFSLGHALEHYALGRARNAIKALAELAPRTAVVQRDGREREIPVAEVRTGDRVVVKPAERIPVDGFVQEGRSGVNQAPITGESIPVDKAKGDDVFAGSVNGEGALVIEVTAAVGDRTLDRVIKLVSEAQTQKAPTQQFTDRFERYFVPLVLIADALLIVVPSVLGFWSWSESFYRAMAVLVAASPCALALGTPAAVLAGIAQAARNGVLIKGGAYLETLGAVKVLALDKTGTITKGEPAVTDVVPFGGTSEADLLATAAAVERQSQHPLAKAVLRAAEERSLDVPDAGELQSVTGRGIRSSVGGELVEVGRLLMFEESGAEVPTLLRNSVAQLEESGRTTMVVRRAPATGNAAGGGWLGVLGLADEPRAEVRQTLDDLRIAGINRIVMLTGDNAGVANAVARAVGIDDVRAGLLPEDKVTAVRELAAQGNVAMVGDGVNDAPALAHATVGIAMGGVGTAAALETADVALMGDDLGRLPFAVGLSRRARLVIRQNVYVSLVVIGLLLFATATGAIGIGPAVVAHEGSTLIVIANALRLLGYKRR